MNSRGAMQVWVECLPASPGMGGSPARRSAGWCATAEEARSDLQERAETILLHAIRDRFPKDERTGSALLGITPATFAVDWVNSERIRGKNPLLLRLNQFFGPRHLENRVMATDTLAKASVPARIETSQAIDLQ